MKRLDFRSRRPLLAAPRRLRQRAKGPHRPPPAIRLSKRVMAAVLGRRLPTVAGTVKVDGIGRPIQIQRDAMGIPYIFASGEAHAWFGVGFCEGQDRGFQIEFLLRAARGRLAEMVGHKGLAMDRLARRLGVRQSAKAQYAALDDDVRRDFDAFARGVNEGMRRGCRKPPHELAITRTRPSLFHAVDALAIVKLLSFAMATNWDSELARLKILQLDGAEALLALDPAVAGAGPAASPGTAANGAIDRLAADIARFKTWVGLGGGSNNWVLAGSRTESGRPLIANDPHLPPTLPNALYLSHIRTPQFTVVGANFVGSPGFTYGYNGYAAWGVTASHADNTDLFVEEIGPDGRSVRQGDGFIPCPLRREVIAVRGKAPVVEDVLITPRGPLVSPALDGDSTALSVSATWLGTAPTRGMVRVHHIRSFADLGESLSDWSCLGMNLLYADVEGDIGWRMVGQAPRRGAGWGAIPQPGADPAVGWLPDPVPAEQLPARRNPDGGLWVTANSAPPSSGDGPYLGMDWFDDYRRRRAGQCLAQRADWTLQEATALQMDSASIPWKELKEVALSAEPQTPPGEAALALLSEWDGRVAADSGAAAVFELWLAELMQRVVRARAPRSEAWALGKGFIELAPSSSLALRRVRHLSQLLRTQPAGWFASGWTSQVSQALDAAAGRLASAFGLQPEGWAWGRVRPVTLVHPFGDSPLKKIFNVGPLTHGGDTNTLYNASVDPADPLANPIGIATMRMGVEVGNWENNTWILAGGQSGNPLSDHYDDMVPLWLRGEGVRVPWSPASVRSVVRTTLDLVPRLRGSTTPTATS